jgi:hypothetical protein
MKKYTILFCFAIALRLAFIWVAPLWYDENFTVLLSRLPLDRMLAATAGDVHPPLWYLITWPLGHLSALPAWFIRIPSALFSIAAYIMFDKVTQELPISQRVRLAAMIGMAILPVNIYYAQEGRMYAMLEFFVLLGFWAVRNLQVRRVWLLLAGVGMLYTQNYGVFYFSALGLIWFVYNWRTWKLVDVISFILPLLLWVPWVSVMLGQMKLITGNYWLVETLSLGRVLYHLERAIMLTQGNAVLEILPIMLFYGLLASGVIYSVSHRTCALPPVLIMAFAPLLMAVTVSLAWQPMLLSRPLIGSVPFLLLLICSQANVLTTPRRTIIALIVVLPILITRLMSIYWYGEIKGMWYQRAETFIQENIQPGDKVYVSGDSAYINLAPYADYEIYLIPECGFTRGQLTAQTRAAMGYQSAPMPSTGRYFVVWEHSPLSPLCEFDQFGKVLPPTPDHILWWDEMMKTGVWIINNSNNSPLIP